MREVKNHTSNDTDVVIRRLYSYYGAMSTSQETATIDYKQLDAILSGATDDKDLFQRIVDAPFDRCKVQTTFLFLGIIVLLLVNKETGMIERIALSGTDLAKRTLKVTAMPFKENKISLDDSENVIAAAIRSGEMKDTTDWKFLFVPATDARQARASQTNAGITYSAVYPLDARDGGALIFSYFQYRELVGDLQHDFMKKYANFVTDRLKEPLDIT